MSGIGGHIEKFESHIVTVEIGTAFGEEMELTIQTKPVITNGFPSVNLAPSDITFLKANRICLANSKRQSTGRNDTKFSLLAQDAVGTYYIPPKHFAKSAKDSTGLVLDSKTPIRVDFARPSGSLKLGHSRISRAHQMPTKLASETANQFICRQIFCTCASEINKRSPIQNNESSNSNVCSEYGQ
ncbi:hypothetical protein COOONC_10151 [Cooperia oncophora]